MVDGDGIVVGTEEEMEISQGRGAIWIAVRKVASVLQPTLVYVVPSLASSK